MVDLQASTGEDPSPRDFSKTSYADLRKTALSGVRFGALSAAGPSGMRPEHLDSALLTSRRSVTARLLRALAALVSAAERGSLPASAHWITQSRLVYLRKPSSDTPRPIRVGEVWRRIIGKRLVMNNKKALQALFLKARQCGVSVPGGWEALVHARRCLDSALSDFDEAFVLLDLDLRNAFPSLEWSAIRAAVDQHAPNVAPWTRWCHSAAAQVRLPDGSWYSCERGAEQGDPLGPVYCALTLLGVAEAARGAAAAPWDGWYMDDSEVLVRPPRVADYLTTFDRELAKVGGSRVADGDFKSTAYLCGSETARAAADPSWKLAAAPTCKILDAPPAKVLGVGIDGEDVREQFRSATSGVKHACDALQSLDDPAVELALLRLSTNVCRVSHLLRAVGPIVSSADLDAVDEVVDTTLSGILGGAVRGPALDRASLSARHGGLGLRRAREVQLPAFVASRTESRALAMDVLGCLPQPVYEVVFQTWDAEVGDAFTLWKSELPPGSAGVAAQLVDQAVVSSRRRVWQISGDLPCSEAPISRTREFVEQSLLVPFGAADPESEATSFWSLQNQLCDLTSATKVARLRTQYEAVGDWASCRLLDDLGDSETNHSWLWLWASHAGPRVRKEEVCAAVRLLIGADVAPADRVCACCGGLLDARGLHALRCAPGDSTRGHYAVASVVHSLASLADSSSSLEPRGLVPSQPALRPADVLTSAAFCIPAALDVNVASPDCEGAGTDVCVSAAARKRDRYAAVLDELAEEGYDYKPLVWSCWGRPSLDVQVAIRSMASMAARRRGLANSRPLELRARTLIAAHLWKRAAAMVLTCLHRTTDADVADLLPAGDWDDWVDWGDWDSWDGWQ